VGQGGLQMGYASAMAWILFVIILAITLFQLGLAKRWVYYESGEVGGTMASQHFKQPVKAEPYRNFFKGGPRKDGGFPADDGDQRLVHHPLFVDDIHLAERASRPGRHELDPAAVCLGKLPRCLQLWHVAAVDHNTVIITIPVVSSGRCCLLRWWPIPLPAALARA
jgi:hypothetical protein